MAQIPLVGWFSQLVFIASLGADRDPRPAVEAPLAPPSVEAPAPDAPLLAAGVAPLGWAMIERRVFRGVSQGVAGFRLAAADRDDAVAVAMARAWRAHAASTEPVRHPEAWGRTIGARVGLDAVRRQGRDRLTLCGTVDPEAEDPWDGSVAEGSLAEAGDPFEQAVDAERRALLQVRIAAWPEAERRLAELLLDGHADSITEAAWRFRAEEEARGAPGTMYPEKARVLLRARRHQLEDLV